MYVSADSSPALDYNLDRDLERCGVVDYDARLFVHQNEQQSVFALTNNTGVVVEGYQYDPYGSAIVFKPGVNGVVDFGGDDVLATSGQASIVFQYTGRDFDKESGLLHYRTRYLDSGWGRFISRDTIGVWGDASSLGNGMAYAVCAAHEGSDPLGTCAWWNWDCKSKELKCAIKAVVVGALAAAFVAATGGIGAAALPLFWGAIISAGSVGAAVVAIGATLSAMFASVTIGTMVIAALVGGVWGFVGCIMEFPFMKRVLGV